MYTYSLYTYKVVNSKVEATPYKCTVVGSIPTLPIYNKPII